MQTTLVNNLINLTTQAKADKILRSCVHCGLCLATCPTYQLTGSELDSPRGRIYLIKNALEDKKTSSRTLTHLDRCLTCRSCETTCPSGVEYGQLLSIGRNFLEQKRPKIQKLKRYVVRKALTTPSLFAMIAGVAQHSPIKAIQAQNPNFSNGVVLLLSGCVQPSLAPNINASATQVLQRLGFEVVQSPKGECCGAIDEHLSATEDALIKIKANLKSWCKQLENGVDTIISTASGCGTMVKDYTHLFKSDNDYYLMAKQVVDATQDIGEFIAKQLESLSEDELAGFSVDNQAISLHTPCTLMHAQKLPNVLPQLLKKLGYIVTQPVDNHLCCGSAGTYSIFQPKLSKQLKKNKLTHLQKDNPTLIVTANIGCLMHLQGGTKTPVKHWIELLAY